MRIVLNKTTGDMILSNVWFPSYMRLKNLITQFRNTKFRRLEVK